MPVVAQVVSPRGAVSTRVEEVRVTGGELSLVTRGAEELETPVVSPDGRRIAYAAMPRARSARTVAIARILS